MFTWCAYPTTFCITPCLFLHKSCTVSMNRSMASTRRVTSLFECEKSTSKTSVHDCHHGSKPFRIPYRARIHKFPSRYICEKSLQMDPTIVNVSASVCQCLLTRLLKITYMPFLFEPKVLLQQHAHQCKHDELFLSFFRLLANLFVLIPPSQ